MNKFIMIASFIMFGLLEGSDVQGFAIPDLAMAFMLLLATAMLVYITVYGGDI